MTRVRVERVLRVGQTEALDEATAHHLTRVLRLRVGASLRVVDGAGQLFDASLSTVDPAVLTVGEALEDAGANPTVTLTMWLPLLKGGKTDDLVRQLTEVGVSRVVPYLSKRSVVKLDAGKAAKRVARWQTIADEATRQCRRTDRVQVTAVERGLPKKGPGVFFYEDGETPLSQAMAGLGRGEPGVLVGPEGGLDATEVMALQAAGWRQAWLGARVLRAETAVVAAAVLVLQELGEFQP